jgi:hypothetical protein
VNIPEHITFRTDPCGALYLGILIAGERHWLAAHEAESISRAIAYKLSDLRKCG